MYINIGPINIPKVLSLQWTSRRINETVAIPYGSVIYNTSVGVELVEYQLSGAIVHTTVEPKLLRQQLTELFENHTRDFVYIEFSEDSNELTGWFLLDGFSTQINPHTFHYEFNAIVKRLSLDNSQMVALYARDDIPLVNDYNFTLRRWVAMPNGQGSTSHNLRTGTTGSARIVVNSPTHYMPYTQTSIINDFRCRIYDTMVKGSLEFFVNSSNIVETGWEERYGLGSNFKGDVVLSNGLIRVVFFHAHSLSSPGNYDIHIWSGSRWEWACRDFTPTTFTTPAPLFIESLSVYDPFTITHFSNDRIEFIEWYSSAGNTALGIKNTLHYGSYFISKELVTRSNFVISEFSALAGTFTKGYTVIGNSISVASDNYATIEFQTGTGFNFKIGCLYTKIPTPTIFGLSLFYGNEVPVNTRFNLGVFAIPEPPPAGTTLANIGREYLSNSTQKRVLINPKWL